MLELKQLRKEYAGLTAVEGISFTLQPGDIFGFIGANGAGKTTTIRMLATLLEPTSGTATLYGYDVVKQPMEIRKQIGYMPDFFGLYDDVKVWEYLDFFATIYEVPVRERKGVIDQALELTDLTGKRDAFVQSLSRGMQQRLCLAKCLVHDPQLLLLDEPASGLDPRARAELKELILELGRMGKIIIVSSHILPELSDFCNTVGIIERGKLLAWGPVSEITKGLRQNRHLRIEVLDDLGGVVQMLTTMPGVAKVMALDARQIKLEFAGEDADQVVLLQNLIAKGAKVLRFEAEQVDLQSVFMELTTGAVN